MSLVNVVVPALGESITEATVAKWHKKAGDAVKQDELLLELETEKVTLEVNAPSAGVMANILKQQGEVVKIGDIAANIDSAGVAAVVAPAPSPSQAPITSVATPQSNATSGGGHSGILSPSAEKFAAENNVKVDNIQGSGRDGRVTKGDVIAAATSGGVSVASSVAGAVKSSDREERVKMSRLRKTIAQRLKDSQNTAAILTTFNEIDMHNVMEIRKKYKDEFEKKFGVKLGFMSFFVKAVVHALKEIPNVNAHIDGDDIVHKNYYDIGVAVGTEQGLVVPIVRDADMMSLAEIESAIGNLGKKAREGKLSVADMTGGTFSITNGGVYGSLLSTPIINPPQSGILGMHNIVQRPMAIDGQVVIRPMMYIALSYDHRIIDGKEAVTFLVKVKNAIENPERLLMGL